MFLGNVFGLTTDLAIDLGTANTCVFVPGRGIVLNEPSVVAFNTEHNRIEAVGAKAREMIGRTPQNMSGAPSTRFPRNCALSWCSPTSTDTISGQSHGCSRSPKAPSSRGCLRRVRG